MKSKKTLTVLIVAVTMLVLTATTAVARPQQCSVICTPSSPPWLLCSVGSMVTTCGEWLCWSGPAQDDSIFEVMPIDQFLRSQR